MWTGNSFFLQSGACLVLAVVALVAAVRTARLLGWRQAAMPVGLGALLAGAGVGLFWLGSNHATFNYRNNQGFPPDWSCSTIVRGQQVCGQDVRAPPGSLPDVLRPNR